MSLNILKDSGYVSFIFVSPGTLPTPGHWWVVTRNEWNSEDTISSVFCNVVAFQWLTILLVWHFRIWSTGELAARNPEYTSCNMVQVSQKAPQPQPMLGLSSRGRKILTFEIVGCCFGTHGKSQPQLAPPCLLEELRAGGQGFEEGGIASPQCTSFKSPYNIFLRMCLFCFLFFFLKNWDIVDLQHCVSL